MIWRTWPLRYSLPSVFGLLTIGLILWDIHNQEIVASVGMGFDTGVPIWPYETARILMVVVSLPAAVPILLLARIVGVEWEPARYVMMMIGTLTFWWWIGSRIDFGLIPRRSIRHPRAVAIGLLGCSIASLILGVFSFAGPFRWWREYGGADIDSLIRLALGVVGFLWCAVAAFTCVVASKRLLSYERRR